MLNIYLKTMKNYFFASIAVMLVFTACDVQNPGPIDEAALNSKEALPGLVVGMSADYSVALSLTTRWGSVWGDDLTHSGTLGAPTIYATGKINSEDVDPWWNNAHRARWVAEQGVERISKVLESESDNSIYAARANLYAGFSNRTLGENVCYAVIDGGDAQDFKTHFSRAEGYFQKAIAVAQNIGNNELLNAAYAGRASVRAAQGDWTGAAADAGQVPTDFVYKAIYSLNSSRENNSWPTESVNRGEYTVWNTKWEDVADPRLPQELKLAANGDTASAANGTSPWITQMKYPSEATDIPIAKGTEMLLIRAEMELRENQDVGAAMTLINQGRTHHGLADLTANDINEAWEHLQDERGKDMWIEGRRFWDLRRWYEETGPSHNDFLDGRDQCVPVGKTEQEMNPHLN